MVKKHKPHILSEEDREWLLEKTEVDYYCSPTSKPKKKT